MREFTSKEENVVRKRLTELRKALKEKNYYDRSNLLLMIQEIQQVSQKLVSKRCLVETLFLKADYYYNLKQSTDSINIYLSIIELSTALKYYDQLPLSHLLLGICYLDQLSLNSALFHLQASHYSIFQSEFVDTHNLKSRSCLYLARCHKKRKEYFESLSYISKLRKMDLSETSLLIQASLIEGSIYLSCGNHDKSLAIYTDLLEISSCSVEQEQVFHLNLCLSAYYRETRDLLSSKEHIKVASQNLSFNLRPLFLLEFSKFHVCKGDFSAAIMSLSEAYSIAKLQPDLEVMVELLLHLSVSYSKLNDHALALEQLETIETLLNSKEVPLIQAEVYSMFAEIYLLNSEHDNYLLYLDKIKSL